MKLNVTKLDPRRLLLGLVLSLLLTPAPAHAGHWAVTFQCSGKGTSSHVTYRDPYTEPAVVASGETVWTVPGFTKTVNAFPSVTHAWVNSSSMKPYVQGDPTTYYASSHTASYNQGDCQFEEPSTYQTEVFGSWTPGWPIWGQTIYPLTDPSPVVGNPQCGFVWDSTENGTVTPVLTWTPDSVTDTEPSPLSVTIQESGQAIAFHDYTFGSNEPGNALDANDGFGDPPVAVPSADTGLPDYVVSEGARMLTADTEGKATVTLPPVALSASGGASGWSENDGGTYISPTWVSLSVLVSDPITASSTAGTVDPHHPQWFSGTACTVQASANPAYFTYNGKASYNSAIPPHAYLRSATLRINGQIVRSYPEDYKISSTDTGASLNVMFDSTHFSNGTPIKIEVECHDSLGRSYTTHLTAPVYNKALVLGNNTFGANAQTSVDGVSGAVTLSNHVVVSSLQDNKTAILNELPQYTVFYIDTHGSVGIFDDCFATDDPDHDADHTIGIVEASIALKPKVPLFPPYNLVFFDACTVMGDKYNNPDQPDDASMSSAFGISGTDRAALGFDWYTYSWDRNAQWTKRLWNYLAQGVPLRQAASLSSKGGTEAGEVRFGFYTSVNPVIQGDSIMTLHGVYGGTVTWQLMTDGFTADIPWYRPL